MGLQRKIEVMHRDCGIVLIQINNMQYNTYIVE